MIQELLEQYVDGYKRSLDPPATPSLDQALRSVRMNESKYNNKKVKLDGVIFDSKSEAAYYWTHLKTKVGTRRDLAARVPS